MNITLDGIPLIWRNQPDTPVDQRTVTNITTTDKRAIVEHEIPGMQGNVFQDMGRDPVRISFDGSFHGKSAKNNLENIRSKFKLGSALPFNSDITGAADVTKVIIEEFRVEETAGIPEMYRYSIVLREYKEPPPEPTTPPSQEGKAKEWAEKTANEEADSINVITGKVLDEDGKPKSGVKVLIKGNDGEYSIATNEEGIYRREDVPPGKYKVTVDDELYEGLEENVTVGSGGEGDGGAGKQEGG
jgi:hypothetical protein